MDIRSYCRWEMGPPASTSTQVEMGELRTHLPARGGGARPARTTAWPALATGYGTGGRCSGAGMPGAVRRPGQPAGPRALGVLVGLPQKLVRVVADGAGDADELGNVEMTRTGLDTEHEAGRAPEAASQLSLGNMPQSPRLDEEGDDAAVGQKRPHPAAQHSSMSSVIGPGSALPAATTVRP